MAAPKSVPVKLTDEERLRDDRVIDCLTQAVGGYHVDSVARHCRCSHVQAGASLRRLAAKGDAIAFETRGSKLWKLVVKCQE